MEKRELDKRYILSILEKKMKEFRKPKRGTDPKNSFKLFPEYDFFSYKPFPSDSTDPLSNKPHSMLSDTSLDYIRGLLYEIEIESGGKFKIVDPISSFDIVPNKVYSPGRARILPFGSFFVIEYNPKIRTNKKPGIEYLIELDFDPQIGVLRYGNETHRFQKGRDGKKLNLFTRLWEDRKIIIDGKEETPGVSRTPEYLALQADIISSLKDFKDYPSKKVKFDSMVRSIERIFKENEFPLEIERNGGIQLIVTEE